MVGGGVVVVIVVVVVTIVVLTGLLREPIATCCSPRTRKGCMDDNISSSRWW